MKFYSPEEDIILVDYIIKKNLHNNVKGRKMWQQMEQDGILQRTWISLKDHYLRVILNQIHCFKILEEDKLKLIKGGSKSSKKNNQSKINIQLKKHGREKNNDNVEMGAPLIKIKKLSQNFLKDKTKDVESNRNIVHSPLTDYYESKVVESTTEWLCRSESSSVINNFNKGPDERMTIDSDAELDATESLNQSEKDSHILNEQSNENETQYMFFEENESNSPLNINVIELNLDEESPVELHNVDEHNNNENIFEYKEMPLEFPHSNNNVNESQLSRQSSVLSDELHTKVNEPDGVCSECTNVDDIIKITINNKTYRMIPKSTAIQKLANIKNQFPEIIVIEDDEYIDLFIKKWYNDYFSSFTNNMNDKNQIHQYLQFKSNYIQKISKQLGEISKKTLATAHMNFLDNHQDTALYIISKEPQVHRAGIVKTHLVTVPNSSQTPAVSLSDSSKNVKECDSSALDKRFTKLYSGTCKTLLSKKDSIETNINLYPQTSATHSCAISNSSDDIISLSDSDSSHVDISSNCYNKKKSKLDKKKQYNANVISEFSYETFCSTITKNHDENQASTQASNLSSMTACQDNCIEEQVFSEIPSSQFMSVTSPKSNKNVLEFLQRNIYSE